MRKIFLIISIVLLMTSCAKKNIINNTDDILYSDLVDKDSIELLKDTLITNGALKEDVNLTLKQIDYYNEIVKDIGLKSELSKDEPDYEVEKIKKKIKDDGKKELLSFDSKITSFNIMKDLITIESNNYNDSMTFLDEEILEDLPNLNLKSEDIENFKTINSTISTTSSNDENIHYNNIIKFYKDNGIVFENKDIKIINMYTAESSDENRLFIKHSAIMLPFDEKYILFEKVNAEEPYQLIVFNNKEEIKSYLLGKYYTDNDSKNVGAIILENDSLI